MKNKIILTATIAFVQLMACSPLDDANDTLGDLNCAQLILRLNANEEDLSCSEQKAAARDIENTCSESLTDENRQAIAIIKAADCDDL